MARPRNNIVIDCHVQIRVSKITIAPSLIKWYWFCNYERCLDSHSCHGRYFMFHALDAVRISLPLNSFSFFTFCLIFIFFIRDTTSFLSPLCLAWGTKKGENHHCSNSWFGGQGQVPVYWWTDLSLWRKGTFWLSLDASRCWVSMLQVNHSNRATAAARRSTRSPQKDISPARSWERRRSCCAESLGHTQVRLCWYWISQY